jgi:hypothetical protein
LDHHRPAEEPRMSKGKNARGKEKREREKKRVRWSKRFGLIRLAERRTCALHLHASLGRGWC